VWIIDRNNEKDGPKFWDMSWTMDKDIASLSINKRTGEALLIDDPENGYDFEFVREGKGLNTRYIGKQISRQSSPISDDERQQEVWLEFITENPIPDVLNFYSYDYIAKIFTGRKPVETDTTDEAPRRSLRERPVREPREVPPPSRRAAKPVEEEEEEDEEPAAPPPRRRARQEVEEEDKEEPPFNGGEEKKPARSRLKAEADEEEEEDVPVPTSFRERMAKVNERNVRR
jgi:hypothetical protein